MNRTTIRKALSRASGGAEFVTTGDIRKCLGCGSDRAAEITKDLDFVRFNRTKQYDIDEVAAKIYTHVERS